MYIHGFSASEHARLVKQAAMLAPAVFEGLDLGNTKSLLEIGCGVGAQTKHLLGRWPHLRIHAIDQNPNQLEPAVNYLNREISNGQVHITGAKAEMLPFNGDCFDAAMTIWVLEHVKQPELILAEAMRVLKPGGRIILHEVDNDSFGFFPENKIIEEWWDKFNTCQQRGGSDPYIGQRLERIAGEIGFRGCKLETLYVVSSTREPGRRLELLGYLGDLLLSGSESLKRGGYVSETDEEDLKREFVLMESQPEVDFQYTAVRLSAIK
jgi:ubiquinone/menaquinone biosynthesis C-methylase UbiE